MVKQAVEERQKISIYAFNRLICKLFPIDSMIFKRCRTKARNTKQQWNPNIALGQNIATL